MKAPDERRVTDDELRQMRAAQRDFVMFDCLCGNVEHLYIWESIWEFGTDIATDKCPSCGRAYRLALLVTEPSGSAGRRGGDNVIAIPKEDVQRAFEIRQAEELLVVVTMEAFHADKRLPKAVREACVRLALPQDELARRRAALAAIDALVAGET